MLGLLHSLERYRTVLMPFQFADRRQVIWMLVLSIGLGTVLGLGLQSTVYELSQWLLPFCSRLFLCAYINELMLIGISFLFLISLPPIPTKAPLPFKASRLVRIGILPLLISLLFGNFKSVSNLVLKDAIWFWIAVPIAEELIFRGWIFNLLNRIFRNSFLPVLPLTPMALWGQSIAFSIWHLQNWGEIPLAFLLLQLLYTFFVGLWLGFYRWHTGRLWPCFLGHVLLNFFADWKLWHML